MSKADQKRYWDANLDPHNLGGESRGIDYAGELPFYLTPDQMHALEHLGDLRGRALLEIGAGIGMNALHTARQGAKVFAIDIAQERLRALMVTASPADGGRIYPVKCSAEALPFRRNCFDAAYSKSVLIHTRLEEALAEVLRCLKSGGRTAFIEPLTRNPFVNLYRRTLAPKVWQSITTYFSQKEINAVLAAFPNMKTRNFYVMGFGAFVWQFAFVSRPLFKACMAAFGTLDSILVKVWPGATQYAWFTVMTASKE